ncbi:MAG: rod shape-determining protein MreD [Alcaligenaceae bacterium]
MQIPNQSKATRSSRTGISPPPVPLPRPVGPNPIDHAASLFFVWVTLLGVWLLSLLPWRAWPMSPDLLLLVLVFWSLHDARRVGLLTAFLFGLVMDAHDVGPLGLQALTYTLTVFGAQSLQRRLLRFELVSQALHLMPLFVVIKAIGALLGAFLVSAWPGWSWLIAALATAALWPLIAWLLLLPQHRLQDPETTAG